MSAAVALRQTASASQALSLFDGVDGEPTLDDLITGVWEGLAVHADAACPICGQQMEPEPSAQARPVGGRCTCCGSMLS